MNIFKNLKKIIKKQEFVKNLEEGVVNYKDYAEVILKLPSSPNEIKKILTIIRKRKLEKVFINGFVNLNLSKFLTYVNNRLNNYYLAYSSVFILLFMVLYLDKEFNINEFVKKNNIVFPKNLIFPKDFTQSLSEIFEIQFSGGLAEFFLVMWERLNFKITELPFKKEIFFEISQIKNESFLNKLLKKYTLFQEEDLFEKYIETGVENDLKGDINKKYLTNVLKIILYFLKNNQRYIVDKLIEKDLHLLRDIIKKYPPADSSLKKEIEKINKILLEKRIKYLKNDIQKLTNTPAKNLVEELKKKEKLKKIKLKLGVIKGVGIYNIDYYFLLNLFFKKIDDELLAKTKNKKLLNLYIDIFIEDSLQEIKKYSDKKYRYYLQELIKKYFYLSQNESLIEIISLLPKYAKIVLFRDLFDIIDKKKFISELNTQTQCEKCAAQTVKKAGLKILAHFYPDFLKKHLWEKNYNLLLKFISR